MTTDSKRADQLLDLALRHARTIRVVIGELAKLNAERELRIITRQLADLTRRAEPAPHITGFYKPPACRSWHLAAGNATPAQPERIVTLSVSS